jgi:plasmid stabilization system protein ParE
VWRLRFSDSAEDDLVAILDYISERSADAAVARRFVSTLRAQCEKLASLKSTMGVARPDLRPGIRSAPFGNYIIFFRYVDDVFEVLNIIEGHRDIGTLFKRDDSNQ